MFGFYIQKDSPGAHKESNWLPPAEKGSRFAWRPGFSEGRHIYSTLFFS
jgi:hypothetical protein